MRESVTGGPQVPLYFVRRLFSSVRNSWNKGWVSLVPAAAVIPAAQVVVAFIGPKALVAGPVSPL
jgi:hypothetical protein